MTNRPLIFSISSGTEATQFLSCVDVKINCSDPLIQALTMVCLQVLGNNTAVTMANAQGQFQLNVYKPLIIHNVIESIYLLSDAMNSFRKNCVAGIKSNDEQLQHYLESTLMLVTALTPHIGYDNAAKAAKTAFEKNITLKQAVLELNLMTGKEFDEGIDVEAMLGDDV